LFVSCRSPLPSELTTQISELPVRSLSKAILFLRDHDGSRSSACENVSSRTCVPSERTVKMFQSPRRLLSNAMRFPSADQVGLPLSSRVSVSRLAGPPLGLMLKMPVPPFVGAL
jgi:hypothetical protein